MSPLSNWAGNHRSSGTVEVVADEESIVRAVRSGKRVKAHGALHSWSDVAMGDQVALSLDGLQGVERVADDRVRVKAGTRLYQLNEQLDRWGLAMPILGSVAQQSLAGAVSTGTHGSSLRYGNLATGVRRARLITGIGEVLTLDEGDERLDGVRVGLGALGILTELEIDVQPAFTLAEAATPMPIERAIEHLPTLVASAEYVKIWWLPHTGMAMVFAAERTGEPSTFSPLERWIDERVINGVAFSGVLGTGRWFPSAVPALNKLVGATYFRPQRRVAPSHRIFNIAMPPKHRESEYAIPYERAQEALRWMVPFVEQHRVNFVVEVRFVKADSGWLSPAFGRDSCQIGAYIGESPDLDSYFRGFEEAMLGFDGRPHWGKEFAAPGAQILGRYPRANDFVALRNTLDPERVFQNRFVEHLFGP